MPNPLKHTLAQGGSVKLMSVRQIKTADIVFMLKEAGFDGFYMDAEHGIFSLREISDLSMAALAIGLTPWLRVHSAEVGTVGPALDAGVMGIIVPHVNTAQEAAHAVSLCQYPPLGVRSMAALGPASVYRRMPAAQAIAQRNQEVMVIAMIETQTGVDHAQAIAEVPGVDALMMGPMDLSLDLGIAGELRHARIVAAYLHVLQVALSAGKHFVGGDAGGPSLAELSALGTRIFMGGNDGAYLMQSMAQAARGMDQETSAKT